MTFNLIFDSVKHFIKKIKINQGVTSILNEMFENCSNLISISIPFSINQIEENSFSNCSSLKSVDYFGLNDLNSNVFSFCSNLKK